MLSIISRDYNPQTNAISLFFAPSDAYVRAGENSFDRLSHITIHEIGHTIDNNLNIINGWHRDGDELRTRPGYQPHPVYNRAEI